MPIFLCRYLLSPLMWWWWCNSNPTPCAGPRSHATARAWRAGAQGAQTQCVREQEEVKPATVMVLVSPLPFTISLYFSLLLPSTAPSRITLPLRGGAWRCRYLTPSSLTPLSLFSPPHTLSTHYTQHLCDACGLGLARWWSQSVENFYTLLHSLPFVPLSLSAILFSSKMIFDWFIKYVNNI